jgi:hypothetical protein
MTTKKQVPVHFEGKNSEKLTAGRELDALVAEKVMGARWNPIPSKAESGMDYPEEHWLQFSEGGWVLAARFPSGKQRATPSLGHYSTSIADAWLVLEQLERDERRILSEITRRMSTFGTHFIYAVVLRQCTAPFPDNWWAEEATAPLSICVAALKAVA